MSILIIGGVTIDILHLPGRTEPVTAAGGAGMYTALAAHRTRSARAPAPFDYAKLHSEHGRRTPLRVLPNNLRGAGIPVTLFAQRPNPLPDILLPIAQTLHWVGPEILLDDLPRLEIAHYGGGKAELLHAHWGAQATLTPDSLKIDLSPYRFIYLAVMVSAHRQLEFLRVCRARSSALIAAGSNGKTAWVDTEAVRELIRGTDLFFMNENEANALFGGVDAATVEPGKRLFITLAERGALVLEGEARTHIPAAPITEVDPTGAGDTFCGATLAGLANGLDAVSAAREGIRLAGENIQAVGPERLLDDIF